MTEENVTKTLLQWLISKDWKIICYDFPQSGTGCYLHPNNTKEKNKKSINPDIVAVKENKCLFFENKSYFYYPDFEKVESLIKNNDYSQAINDLIKGHAVEHIYYGIGYPSEVHKRKAEACKEMVDFIIGISQDSDIKILYQKYESIFS